jgi:hypothetical protein
MKRRTLFASVLAAAAVTAASFAPAASARTAWNVTIGAPGFVVSAGEPYVAAPYYAAPAYRPYWHHHHHHYRYAPPVVYEPAPVYVPPRVVYRPAYVDPPVVYRPYYPY